MRRLPQFFELRSAGGHRIVLCDYGARLCSWEVPDRKGMLRNVVLGFARPEDYLKTSEIYHGAIIGRCAGRIRNAQAHLNGRLMRFTVNEGSHHLHGGPAGFHAHLWQSERPESQCFKFSLTHPHGSDGYPGDLKAEVIYRLAEPDALFVSIRATANAATPFTPTHHPFWNLHGEAGKSVKSHRLRLWASTFFPVTEDLLPEGALLPVTGRPLDLTRPGVLEEILADGDPQIRIAGGLDHTFLCDEETPEAQGMFLQACLHEPETGLSLEVWSTFPCLHVYSGQKLNGTDTGRDGKPLGPFSGLCLEPSFYPDFMNHRGFTGNILCPGETFTAHILYKITSSNS